MATCNPWDQAPFPKRGEKTEAVLFTSIGAALTEWEKFEERLSWVFGALVTGGLGDSVVAVHVYGTILTFRGRSEMIAAATAVFDKSHSISPAVAALKEVLKLADKFAPRRNEIAHGIVGPFLTEEEQDKAEGNLEYDPKHNGYALLPSSYNTNKHQLIALGAGKPEEAWIYRRNRYAYTCRELNAYRKQFTRLYNHCARAWLMLTLEIGRQETPPSP